MIGSILFAILTIYGLFNMPSKATTIDYGIFVFYALTAWKCLTSSFVYHTFNAHHKPITFDKCLSLDFCGISLLICGSYSIYLYYSLYCHTQLQQFYMMLVAFLCAPAVILPWFPFFRNQKYKDWRTAYFVALVAVLFFISFHSAFLVGISVLLELTAAEHFFIELAVYALGIFFYASKFPEKLYPGKLDIWFHSHQLWHVFILLAALCHFWASWGLIVSRLSGDSCALHV